MKLKYKNHKKTLLITLTILITLIILTMKAFYMIITIINKYIQI